MTHLLTRPILIVDYNPRWPTWYAEEKACLLPVLSPLQVRLEHIGSTSVPGLAAKPILDISAALADRNQIEAHLDGLSSLGYAEFPLDPRFERRMFCKGPYNEGTHHLHITTYGTPVWAEPILFRDYLRAHPAVAAAYAAVKRKAADHHQRDLNGYHDEKSALIGRIMEQAHAWRRG
jgi:GrpB-like predicted nucleotidyltransferase (UPF0157 family)